jgi:hypothetical protein
MRIIGFVVQGLGVVFIALGIADFTVHELLRLQAAGLRPGIPDVEPGIIIEIILALSELSESLSDAPAYVSATILGVLLLVIGIIIVHLSPRR